MFPGKEINPYLNAKIALIPGIFDGPLLALLSIMLIFSTSTYFIPVHCCAVAVAWPGSSLSSVHQFDGSETLLENEE